VVVTVTALVVGSLGGWWALDRMLGGGYPFPDSIDGVARTHVGDAAELPLVGASGVEGEVGIYGSGVTPDFAMVVIDVPEGTDMTAAWEEIPMVIAEQGGRPRNRKAPSAQQFVCGPNPMQPEMGACLWLDGNRIVELDALTRTAEELRPIGMQVYTDSVR
jgi:hypothetical protein